MKRTAMLFGILCATGAMAYLTEGNYLPVGSVAPQVAGMAQNGKMVNSGELVKKGPVFVVFWKQRCPHNPKATALFNGLAKAYEGKVNLIGVVNAPAEGIKQWSDGFSVNYPLLSDPMKSAINQYQLKYSITTVQIGTDGKVAKVFEGYGSESMDALNQAMASVAGTKASVDFSMAPSRLTWG